MFALLPGMIRRSPGGVPAADDSPRVPDGVRVYAVGDVHGQGELLRELLARIVADTEARAAAETRLVFLGDLIDRGADSAHLLRLFTANQGASTTCLLGNHEEALLQVVDGDMDAASAWLTFGGAATLAGFGVDVAELDPADPEAVVDAARAAIPAACVQWLRELPHSCRIGDYFFTHAGVRPRVPLEAQNPRDLLWIRRPFLDSRRWHGAVVVHGHTPTGGHVEFRPNRIGVDTGAYETGLLSAVALEGTERWVLTAQRGRPIAPPSGPPIPDKASLPLPVPSL